MSQTTKKDPVFIGKTYVKSNQWGDMFSLYFKESDLELLHKAMSEHGKVIVDMKKSRKGSWYCELRAQQHSQMEQYQPEPAPQQPPVRQGTMVKPLPPRPSTGMYVPENTSYFDDEEGAPF